MFARAHAWTMQRQRPTTPPTAGRRRNRWGVRKRATAIAVAGVAVALMLGGSLLLVLLQASLIASTQSLAQRTGAEVVTQMTSQGVTVAGEAISTTSHTGQNVQILTARGIVVASSDTPSAGAPFSALRPAAGQTLVQSVSSIKTLGDHDDFLVVATGVRVGGNNYVVQVAATVQVQMDTVTTVAWFILGAAPVLIAVVGASVWLMVGRSLRQVERIRSQVARINVNRLDERVDVPQTRDEIDALARTMNTMLDRLQTSDRQQRQFISDASHELRSPLATIRAGVEVSVADPSGTTWLELCDVIAGEAARMQYLVEDLLTLAKADDGGITVVSEDVDLDDVLDFEIKRLKATSRHQITSDLVPARVAGDPRRLGQVLGNILDNADRHARMLIHVGLGTERDGTVVVVIDNDGDPVPLDDRERIFDRFVRLDESRTRESGGGGLGLAIAAGLVAAHRGSIRAGETDAGWCRFEVRLPPSSASCVED
jgi:signal transduction histidine kinase